MREREEKKETVGLLDQANWQAWLEAKGLSERTIFHYNSYFLKVRFDRLDQDYVNKWIKRHNNPVARATLNNLKEYAMFTDHFPPGVREQLKNMLIPKFTGRKKQTVVKVISREEVDLLIKKIPHYAAKMLVLLSFYGGLRSAEALGIRYEDCDFGERKITIRGKGNKEREVLMTDMIGKELGNYINFCLEQDEKLDHLFPFTDRHWRRLIREYSIRYIGKPIHPHTLRHSAGTFLFAQKNWDTKEIADFLGHASIMSTQIYIHLDKTKQKEKIIDAFK